MNVDGVWKGWLEPGSTSADVGPHYETQLVFEPHNNRYSVNMDERSISDVSMFFGEGSEEPGSPTPRSQTPTSKTPVAEKKAEKKGEAQKSPKEPEDEDEEDDDDATEHGEEDDTEEGSHSDQEDEKKVKSPTKSTVKSAGKREQTPAPFASAKRISLILSPMDEDPRETMYTPKPPSPIAVPETPKAKPRKRSATTSSTRSKRERTPDLATRTSTLESTPPKTPKLRIQTTDLTPKPSKMDDRLREANLNLSNIIDNILTQSPTELGIPIQEVIR